MNDNATNTLNELNEILFENLRKLDCGEIDAKQATAVVNVSNSIINNAKTQMAAYKLTSDRGVMGAIGQSVPQLTQSSTKRATSISEKASVRTITAHDRLTFAKELGYTTIADAIKNKGSWHFEQQLKEFLKG